MGTRRGRFITIEGIEGVGKTTNIEMLQDLLDGYGVSLTITREPGGTPLAEEIRELLLCHREEKVVSNAELLLVFAARAQHLGGVIEPILAAGDWVISDRFTDATYAYQGYGRGLSLEKIRILEELVQGPLQPDLTIVLDAPVETGLGRASARSGFDRFESENQAFFARVRQGYLERVALNPDRYCLVDATQPLAMVQGEIREAMEQRIAAWLP